MTSPVAQRSLYRQLRPGPGRGREEVLANQRSRLIAATIELVDEQGYDDTTVSNIVQLAGVSKASFYEQFDGKEECFTAACDTALRAAASAVLHGESSAGEGRDRLRAGLTALADLIAARPKAARLVLIDGLASTPAIRAHVCRRFGLLEALARERLATAGQEELPDPLVAGVVRGIEHHARSCVGADRPERFRDLIDPLLDWGLALSCGEASEIFGDFAVPTRATLSPAGDRSEAIGDRALVDTRDLLLAATLRLASNEGFLALTPSRIRRAAGVSRRSFDASFDDATSCFLASVDTELGALFAQAIRSAEAEADWGKRTCLVLDRLAISLAAEPDLTRLVFVESLDAALRSLLWRERLIADWAEALYRGAPPATRPSPTTAEATIAAIWGLFSDLVAAQRLQLLPAQTERLAFFVLVPVLGAGRAIETVRVTRGANSRFFDRGARLSIACS